MKDDEGDFWFDREPGPLVRPFALTGGRVGTEGHGLNLITLVSAPRPLTDPTSHSRERVAIVRMCAERPLSVAEISARVNVLVAVAKILISDLIDEGLLIARPPAPTESHDEPDMNLLQAVLDGVRNI
jgi:Protein of unknown function (DUF742)